MTACKEVRPVSRQDCAPFIMGIHYAKRFPSITFRFGLFVDGLIEGIVTYGTPASAPLRRGLCGDDYADDVLELNRLCLKGNHKNDASFLVSKSLRLLAGNRVIVSFADTAQGHIGTVYQAANFIYCGLSAKRTDWKLRGKEHLHGQTVADEFRGKPDRAGLMRAKYGDDFYLSPRPRKHRYVYIIGSKGYRSAARKMLRYPVMPYPKIGGV